MAVRAFTVTQKQGVENERDTVPPHLLPPFLLIVPFHQALSCHKRCASPLESARLLKGCNTERHHLDDTFVLWNLVKWVLVTPWSSAWLISVEFWPVLELPLMLLVLDSKLSKSPFWRRKPVTIM